MTALCDADFLKEVGKRTPVATRFSTVVHERGSPESLRDVRGYSVKFYTEEGNWDFVGEEHACWHDPLTPYHRPYDMRRRQPASLQASSTPAPSHYPQAAAGLGMQATTSQSSSTATAPSLWTRTTA